MSIDYDLLDEIQRNFKPAYEQIGIGQLPRSIHRNGELENWITLESFALPPIPVLRLQQWQVVSLIVVATTLDDGSQGYFAPWGVVIWSVATKRVLEKIDLTEHPVLKHLRTEKISTQPVGISKDMEQRERIVRENLLYAALDYVCAEPTREDEVAKLAPHYAGLLCKQVYPYYHGLVPESQIWLDADVPAFDLEISK